MEVTYMCLSLIQGDAYYELDRGSCEKAGVCC